MSATTPTLAELRDDPRVRRALQRAIEMADACDGATRLLLAELHTTPENELPVEFVTCCAEAAGASAQAWAAVHAATRRNGAKD